MFTHATCTMHTLYCTPCIRHQKKHVKQQYSKWTTNEGSYGLRISDTMWYWIKKKKNQNNYNDSNWKIFPSFTHLANAINICTNLTMRDKMHSVICTLYIVYSVQSNIVTYSDMDCTLYTVHYSCCMMHITPVILHSPAHFNQWRMAFILDQLFVYSALQYNLWIRGTLSAQKRGKKV